MDPKPNITEFKSPIPFEAHFTWSVGVLMEKFIEALGEKKLLASKCPGCGYVVVPPRNRCGKCCKEMGEDDLVELSGKATLAGWTVGRVRLDGAGGWEDLEVPEIIAAVKPEGADSTLYMPLGECGERDLSPGMALVLQWRGETTGEIADMAYFKPA
ncbi:MAG: hypothetical protein JRI97_11750 [Deltaproteobacteria bacterium]|nr:hypothetical protein [Deltaproteobacteria bacterium]